jgi:hypothetical protein
MEEERKKEILEKLEKASSEEYVTSWDEKGVPKSKSKEKIKKGKSAKKSGSDFELKVRKDLESKGWILAKWSNNVDLEKQEIISAKKGMVFNPFFRRMMPTLSSTGFPDFIAFQLVGENVYNVIGIESKTNGTLSKEEKEKCAFLLNKKVFNHIWISSKKEDGTIEYLSFKDEYGSKFNVQ